MSEDVSACCESNPENLALVTNDLPTETSWQYPRKHIYSDNIC